MITTYTVRDTNGEAIARHLTAAAAAHIILTDDGRDYEIRPHKDGGYTLFTRQQVANNPWSETAFFSAADTLAEAEAVIFFRVVQYSQRHGHPTAVPDCDYDVEIAALADELETESA